MVPFLPAEFIKKKRCGQSHLQEEIAFFIDQFSKNMIPDYQASAWLMAAFLQGLNHQETRWLTESLLHSGEILDFSDLGPRTIDKHSTGGVGDKTSLILAPLMAAAGVYNPMMAGRGLGHTGGTLDKLESIPGFNVHLELKDFQRLVRRVGAAIMGQTKSICVADLKLYALRDVTATVESIPLICASIMSKKMAEGIQSLVLDVKHGSGAFMKTHKDAENLAQELVEIGCSQGLKTRALLTDMDQPLGGFIGNALEVQECLDIMSGKTKFVNGVDLYQNTRELSLQLAGHMLTLSGVCPDAIQGQKQARLLLDSGQVLNKFYEMAQAQGAHPHWKLPQARHSLEVVAPQAGFMSSFNCEGIGLACLELGAGRRTSEDSIDHAAGISILVQRGSHVEKGQPLFQLWTNEEPRLAVAQIRLQNSLQIKDQPPASQNLVTKIIYEKGSPLS